MMRDVQDEDGPLASPVLTLETGGVAPGCGRSWEAPGAGALGWTVGGADSTGTLDVTGTDRTSIVEGANTLRAVSINASATSITMSGSATMVLFCARATIASGYLAQPMTGFDSESAPG
jgi:hypothetical protein